MRTTRSALAALVGLSLFSALATAIDTPPSIWIAGNSDACRSVIFRASSPELVAEKICAAISENYACGHTTVRETPPHLPRGMSFRGPFPDEYFFYCTRTDGVPIPTDALTGYATSWSADSSLKGKDRGKCCEGIGNPIHGGAGNKYESLALYSSPGASPILIELSYNSIIENEPKGFGVAWRHSYERTIRRTNDPDGNPVLLVAWRPDGRVYGFRSFTQGIWTGDNDLVERLEQMTDGRGAIVGWRFIDESDNVELYSADGTLLSITDRAGLSIVFSYSDGLTPTTIAPKSGLLTRITEAFGRSLLFTYNANAQITRMTDLAGGAYSFAYDADENLTAVVWPDGKVRTFHYNEPSNTSKTVLKNALTGITDENGQRFATYKYDVGGTAVSSEHAGGAGKVTLSYAGTSTTVVDALGSSKTLTLTGVHLRTRISAVSQPCSSCAPTFARIAFDANGNVASIFNFNNNRTSFVYDLTRNLETRRVEGLTPTGLVTPQSRTISTQWHPAFRLRTRLAEPLRITTYVYNGDAGSRCSVKGDGTTLVQGVLCSKTVQPTTDANGGLAFGAAASGPARTWNYTYNTNGSVLSVDGPRTDVSDITTYTYYANDDPDLSKRGNVATITNALGHVTSITAYNAHGEPTTVVDPNGMITTLVYDERRRLTARNVGGETTTYDYDGVGQATRVTLPDGSFLSYSYDAAHRLTGISDGEGNRIAYTLDAMGNRTQEQVFGPSNALARMRGRIFNSLNRLVQEIGAAGQITTYSYDNQGNITSVTDPLTHQTINAYDALNRLVRVTDPGLGVTQYAYDGIDQLTRVTDPRGLITSYTYDGLGNLKQQQSPDTGMTENVYDSAGNLLSQTDAKGQSTTYAYDPLNRVTSIVFADSSRQTYSYDQGANGVGRLSQITESNADALLTSQTVYSYDLYGRVRSETRAVAGVNYTTAYQYDSFGRMTGITYPSGRQITLRLDSLGRTREVWMAPPNSTMQAIALNVTYQPFGGVNGYILGHGGQVLRGYDVDGRIASYNLGPQTFAVGYDAASRIAFIADTADPASGNTYGYDLVDRLTSAVIPNNQYAYAYDAVGNRISKTVGSSTDVYAYATTSNRIASITALVGATRSFAFDPNGSTTSDGMNQYVYDARGRMVRSIGVLGPTTYQVNALGQRVRKTNSTDDRVFHYDTKGRLIAETDPGGAVKREYIYLGDIPLAVIQ